MVHVITPVYKDVDAFDICLSSVMSQTGSEYTWHVIYDEAVNTPSDMTMFEDSVVFDNPDVHFYKNGTRKGALASFIRGATSDTVKPDDILVTLDGDDWFIRPDALSRIEEEYKDPMCWLTYGSWVSNAKGYPALLPAYKEYGFRGKPWLYTHPRTCKRWLFDLVKDEDLRDKNGDYFLYPSDIAVCLPMIEMAGLTHSRHIPEALMMYNRTSKYAMPDPVGRKANLDYILAKPPYKPLPKRPIDND